jgi:hypothetical protein
MTIMIGTVFALAPSQRGPVILIMRQCALQSKAMNDSFMHPIGTIQKQGFNNHSLKAGGWWFAMTYAC